MSSAQTGWYRVVFPDEQQGYGRIRLPAPDPAEGWTQDLRAVGQTVRSAQALGLAARVEYWETRWEQVSAAEVQERLPDWGHDGALTAEAARVGLWVTDYREAWRWGRIETPPNADGHVGVRWRGKFTDGVPVLWVRGWCCATPHPAMPHNLRPLTAEELASFDGLTGGALP